MRRKVIQSCCWTVAVVAALYVSIPRAGAQESGAAATAQETESEEVATSGSPSQASKESTSLIQNLRLEGLWQDNGFTPWALLLLACLAGIVAGKAAAVALQGSANRFEARGWLAWRDVLVDLIGPLKLTLLALLLAVGLADLKMSPPLRLFCSKTLLLLYCTAAFWYLFNLTSLVERLLRQVAGKTGSTLDRELAPMIRKTLRFILVVMTLLFMINSVFEKDIGAWLAGLGIAGLAVSLAAQDSLKSLFGSVTILLDQPFRVGDRIVFGNYEGTIEEIGFRSTRLRTSNGHLVTIPNSRIASEPIENPARRPFIRRVINLAVACDTPPAKIDQAVQAIRKILDRPGIREPLQPVINAKTQPPRVYFSEINRDSLNIQITYCYAPDAYWEYMEHAQALNLCILQELADSGIRFAALPAAASAPSSDGSTEPTAKTVKNEQPVEKHLEGR